MSAIRIVRPAWKPKILIADGVRWKNGNVFITTVWKEGGGEEALFRFLIIFFTCRCTVRSACQQASQSLPRWLSYGAGQQCIDFEQVLPDRIPINQITTVSISFDQQFVLH